MTEPLKTPHTASRSQLPRRESTRAGASAKREGFAALFAGEASSQPTSIARPAPAVFSAPDELRDAARAPKASNERFPAAYEPGSVDVAPSAPTEKPDPAAASAGWPAAVELRAQPQVHVQGLSEVVEFAVLIQDARGVHHLQLGVTSGGAGAQSSYDIQLAALGNGRIALKVRGVGAKDGAVLAAQRELARRLRERGLEVIEEDSLE